MPKSKPSILSKRHNTKADRAARTASESALTPITELTNAIPPILRGREHAKAKRTWKRIIGLYHEVEGIIATAFDQDRVIEYCLLMEEVDELALDRRHAKREWKNKLAQANRIKLTDDNADQWVKIWGVVNALNQKFLSLDARLDGKRKHLHKLSQDLYLTPRSRAGVAPPVKEPEKPKSEMEKLLDE